MESEAAKMKLRFIYYDMEGRGGEVDDKSVVFVNGYFRNGVMLLSNFARLIWQTCNFISSGGQ